MAKKTYGLAEEKSLRSVAAPKLPYEPKSPKKYDPGIALIGCGGISQTHLKAYKKAGFRVVALCDNQLERAEARRIEFFPDAKSYDDYHQVFARDDVHVVDLTPHPAERVQLIKDALHAKKHVLSQKPFVTDIDTGKRLADLADSVDRRLAVNQNGRWAPHYSYMRQAVGRGLIGDVLSVHMSIGWNHDWTAGTIFDSVRHLILYDFGIHWFDLVCNLLRGRRIHRVFASTAHAIGQKAKPHLLGQALIEAEGAQATLVFDGFSAFGPRDGTAIVGTKGTLHSTGPNLSKQEITLYTSRGVAKPELKGTWFPDGFHGTMGELLCAIEENREPTNAARDVLKSLELCFAALQSADTGKPAIPGKVRRMRD